MSRFYVYNHYDMGMSMEGDHLDKVWGARVKQVEFGLEIATGARVKDLDMHKQSLETLQIEGDKMVAAVRREIDKINGVNE
jgi:hypothetical protein